MTAFERWLEGTRGQATWAIEPPAVVVSGSCQSQHHALCPGACLVDRAVVFAPHSRDVVVDATWAHVPCQCNCHHSSWTDPSKVWDAAP
jgi:hypothetical protein